MFQLSNIRIVRDERTILSIDELSIPTCSQDKWHRITVW